MWWNFFTDAFNVLALSALFLIVLVWFLSQPRGNLPPGPRGLPILGYLPFLDSESFKTFQKLSNKYGSVFSLYLGRKYTVVINDSDSMKEALSKSSLLSRPPHIFDDIPEGIGFVGTNGEEWLQQRKYSIRAMRNLGLGKGSWEESTAEEVADFIELVHSFKGKTIDIFTLLTSSVASNVNSLSLGKRFEKGGPEGPFLVRCLDALSEIQVPSRFKSFLPGLHQLLVSLGVIGSDEKNEKMAIAFHEFIKKHVDEQIVLSEKHDELNTFVSGYIKEMRKVNSKDNTTFTEKNLRGNVKSLFLGGSDTSNGSLMWLFFAMVAYPDIQRRVREELRTVLGHKQVASWEDRLKLPYTFAVIMEGQRWKTVVPLSVTRIATDDTTIRGYFVPRGTSLIVNQWAMHNDPKYWKDPEKFVPERFIEPETNANFKPESYIPFSYGKRNCPGETVALMQILLYFSAIILNFEIQSKNGDQEVWLSGKHGVVYHPREHELRFVPLKN